MRKAIIFSITVSLTAALFAQAPQKMDYQAVVRDAENQLVSNTVVGMQISILQGSESGTPVFVETHTPQTSVNGLVSIEIGGGTVATGEFSLSGEGPYFVKTEIDPSGGTDYTLTSTCEFLSVPYAFYAETTDKLLGAEEIPESFAIGDNYGGGIVFYVTPDGKSALIAANQDQEHYSDPPVSMDSVKFYGREWYARAPEYHDDEGKNYTDWRVPDLKELQLMYEQRDMIGGFTDDIADESIFPGSWYLSNTGYYSRDIYAMNFATTFVTKTAKKDAIMRLRAVRSVRLD